MRSPKDMSKAELLTLLGDAAKNWLAHDGLWFLEVERESGIETAMKLDRQAWERFTVIEAKRIMERLNVHLEVVFLRWWKPLAFGCTPISTSRPSPR